MTLLTEVDRSSQQRQRTHTRYSVLTGVLSDPTPVTLDAHSSTPLTSIYTK